MGLILSPIFVEEFSINFLGLEFYVNYLILRIYFGIIIIGETVLKFCAERSNGCIYRV